MFSRFFMAGAWFKPLGLLGLWLSLPSIDLLRGSEASGIGSTIEKGPLLYANALANAKDLQGWVMEGEGVAAFRDGWMHLYSPDEASHHVYWCPEDFPDRFVAEWEAQNLETDAGLCILFFAAKGVNGEDIFDPALPLRDGTFSGYTRGQINSYHISYYSNTPKRPDRGKAHLRKNNQFNRVQEGYEGIPADSTAIHRMRLIKDGSRIRFFIDGRKILDWADTVENEPRPPHRDGKIGFRQMQWTHFRYRNFRVWGIEDQGDSYRKMARLPVIHPKKRLWAEPSGGREAAKNPPIFKWPPHGGSDQRYAVRLSRDPDFEASETIREEGIPWTLYNPHRTLESGLWHWQYRGADDEEWSRIQRFLISEASHPWDPPHAKRLLDAIPEAHPRVLVDAAKVSEFREGARNRPEATRIIREANAVFGQRILSESRDIAKIEGETPDKTDKLRKDASKAIGQSVFDAVGPLCQAYALTGDLRYADLAIEWAREVVTWDPRGVTTINDFGDSRIMLSMALVYDTLHERLPDADKADLLEAIAARANKFYRQWKNNKEAVVLSNHIWQHIFHYFFDTALAVKGDVAEADQWLAFLYEMFLARAPILGGRDGGWVHGESYFRMNFETLIDVPWRIREYTGFDFFESAPWYKENIYYLIYGFQPGSYASGFGDHAHKLSAPSGKELAYADALSRIIGNPHAAWYRDEVAKNTGIRIEETDMLRWARLRYLYETPAAPPKAPEGLPKARVFREVGLVTMHSRDLEEPVDENLFAAMRASPFGTYSHMLSDNNTFNLVYGGDRLFFHTGYMVAMSSVHRQQYYKHTKSHNGILVGGQGQPYHTEAFAWIESFLSGEHLSYAVGNASRAYDSPSEGFDAGLKTFKRRLLRLGSDMLVVYDELEADKPVEWSFLLHSYQEIAINPERRTLTIDNRAGRAQALLHSSAEDVWSVTDEYEIPAENWRGLRDDQGELIEYPNNAWHFASRTEKSTSARFLAVIQVRPHRETGNYEFYEYLPLDSNTGRLGRWKLFAQLDPGKPAEIRVTNQIDQAALASRGKSLRISGTEYVGESAESAKLVEWRDGRWTFQEKHPEIPIAAKIALDFLTESEAGAATFVKPYEDD